MRKRTIVVIWLALLIQACGDDTVSTPTSLPRFGDPDGLVWSRVSHDETFFGGHGDQWMTSLVAGGPGLVAVGADTSGADGVAAGCG